MCSRAGLSTPAVYRQRPGTANMCRAAGEHPPALWGSAHARWAVRQLTGCGSPGPGSCSGQDRRPTPATQPQDNSHSSGPRLDDGTHYVFPKILKGQASKGRTTIARGGPLQLTHTGTATMSTSNRLRETTTTNSTSIGPRGQ